LLAVTNMWIDNSAFPEVLEAASSHLKVLGATGEIFFDDIDSVGDSFPMRILKNDRLIHSQCEGKKRIQTSDTNWSAHAYLHSRNSLPATRHQFGGISAAGLEELGTDSAGRGSSDDCWWLFCVALWLWLLGSLAEAPWQVSFSTARLGGSAATPRRTRPGAS
jgi:hypothetical protein